MVTIKICNSTGLTLLEVLFALTLGAIIIIASIFGVRSYINDSNYRKSKIMLQVIRTNINNYRYKKGTYPTGPTITANANKEFYPDVPSSVAFPCNPTLCFFPGDPFFGNSAIANGLNPAGPPSVGGWYYDQTSGTFKINLVDSEYQNLFPEKPSKW